MKITIKSSKQYASQCSFDFVHSGDYDYKEVYDAVWDAFDAAGVEPTDIDFRSVDYSMYPEYASAIVSQCGVTFIWSGSYSETDIEDAVSDALSESGLEVIGIMFESADWVD